MLRCLVTKGWEKSLHTDSYQGVGNLAEFKYFGKTVRNQNLNQ
jgi:hypothetical protein